MSAATATAPEAKTTDKAKLAPLTQVRRHKGNTGWVQPSSERTYFKDDGDFKSGILTNAVFVHEAPPMFCIGGYYSTGEAIGTLEKINENPQMPEDAKRTLALTYDIERRRFHGKGEPDNIPFWADYLVLGADGSATAGWKN